MLLNALGTAIIGSVIRTVLAVASGAGAATAPSVTAPTEVAPTDDLQLLISAIGGLVTVIWSIYQKRRALAPVEERKIS